MALDTRSKRASSVGILLFSILAPPLPDGTIGQADRQHIAVSYSGISATASNNGTFSVTLGALTLSATGTVEVQGQLTQTLGALTLVATGTVATTGTQPQYLANDEFFMATSEELYLEAL